MDFSEEAPAVGRLSLPPEMVGNALSFLDGRSLTNFEVTSKGARQLFQDCPNLFKTLLVRQLANVPQMEALSNKEGKSALIAWDGGDFQPVLAASSAVVPCPRYLHRVALGADGWYYLFGGHVHLGMSGDVWRFCVEPPKDGRVKRSSRLRLRWEQVDGTTAQDAGGSSDNDHGQGEGSGVESDGNGSDYSDYDEEEEHGSSTDDALTPPVVVMPPPLAGNNAAPPNAHHAHHGLGHLFPPAMLHGAGGGAQAAMWAGNQGVAGGAGENPAGVDADGNRSRPRPRCAASWASIPGTNKIYLFGGVGSDNDFLGDLWCFHAGARGECRWEQLHAEREARPRGGDDEEEIDVLWRIPEGRWGHTMVEHRGALYMFGGSSPGQAFAGLWRLDTSVRPCVWSLLTPDGEQPPARGGHSATVVRDTLYIFGGNITQSVFNDLWAIDLAAGSAWRQIQHSSDFPLPRIGHSAVAMGNRILIYGGRNSNTDRYTAGLSCFDTDLQSFVRFPHAEAFSRRAAQPRGMWHGLRMTGHSAVPCSRGLMIVGGLVPRGHSTMSAWLLDVVKGRRRVKKQPRRRSRVLATAGGCGTS